MFYMLDALPVAQPINSQICTTFLSMR